MITDDPSGEYSPNKAPKLGEASCGRQREEATRRRRAEEAVGAPPQGIVEAEREVDDDEEWKDGKVCEECGGHFPTRTGWETHIYRRCGDKELGREGGPCKLCGASLSRARDLARHFRQAHGNHPISSR